MILQEEDEEKEEEESLNITKFKETIMQKQSKTTTASELRDPWHAVQTVSTFYQHHHRINKSKIEAHKHTFDLRVPIYDM